MARRLLLLSNSRNPGMEYLEHAQQSIREFLGDDVKEVLFLPYAGVTVSFGDYASFVARKFTDIGYGMHSIADSADARSAVKEAHAIAVGGGNTFHLLSHVYSNALLDLIRERVSDGLPYMGWSAGSNLACPTIKTTNDMPIVQPPSFEAMGVIPFQINPHYLDAHPAGHGGETREDRIREFIEVNRDMYVAGLREGSALRVEGSDMKLLGEKPLRVFRFAHEPVEVEPGDDVNFLLG